MDTATGEVNVALIARPGQPPRVDVGAIGNDFRACYIGMTVTEARRFALAVLATCDLAEAPQGEVA